MNIETEDKIATRDFPDSFVDVDKLIECIQECCDEINISTDFSFRQRTPTRKLNKTQSLKTTNSYSSKERGRAYHIIKDYEELRKQYRSAAKKARKLYNNEEQEQTLCNLAQAYVYAPIINDEVRREIANEQESRKQNKTKSKEKQSKKRENNSKFSQDTQDLNNNRDLPPLPYSTAEERDTRRKILMNTRKHPPIEEDYQAVKEWEIEMERIDGVMSLLTQNERNRRL
eukprot:gb/GECH01009151.1/.p1 GENE.gb/GECH01009151.1/~~gb/GECH01009151.1/.p1  ORF type:complete len:229 (+),score=74.45 gb/GECH01009151.1/:1-687(+)